MLCNDTVVKVCFSPSGQLGVFQHKRPLDLGGSMGEASQKRTMRFGHRDLKRPMASNKSAGNNTNAPDAYKA